MSLETVRNEEISLLERHDLLSGEPRYIEDEIRNSKFATIFGGLAGVLCLVAAILAWIFWHRDRKNISLWNAILLTVAALVGFLIAAWGSSSGKLIASGRNQESGMSLAAFLLAILFAVYLAAATVYFIIYKNVHDCRLANWKSDTPLWNKYMPDSWDLSKGIVRDNRLRWWIVLLMAISALLFALAAFCIWSCSNNRYKMASFALGLACVGLVVFGFLLLYWVIEAQQWSSFPANSLFEGFPLKMLKVAAIVGIVIGFVSLIARILNKSVLHFVAGFAAIIFALITIIGVGLVLRSVYQNQINPASNGNCSENMASIHRDSIKTWCPNKYLADGKICRKQDSTTLWEDKGQPATLNPGCCNCVKNFFTWPYQMVGFFGLIFAMCLVIAGMTNFYLADNYSQDAFSKAAGAIDYALLGLAVIALIIFALYFGFRNKNRMPNSNNSFKAFHDDSFTDPNFQRVKASLKESNSAAGPAVNPDNYKFNAINNLATFDSSATAACNDVNTCISRLAVLSKNAQIIAGTVDGVTAGASSSKYNFFPDCTSRFNDFKVWYGKTEAINKLLQSIEFKPRDSNVPNPDALYYIDQVKAADVKDTGLLATEVQNNQVLTETNPAECGTGFTAGATCTGTCKSIYNPNLKTTVLKGSLWYLNNGVKDTTVDGNIQVSAWKGNTLIKYGSVTADGIYLIPDVPVHPDTSAVYNIKVEDTAHRFLTNEFETVVPAGADTETSAGVSQLLTADGKLCDAADSACITAQKLGQGIITVHVTSTEDGKPLNGAKVILKNTSSVKGTTAAEGVTNGEGNVDFKQPYGYYNAVVDSAEYRHTIETIQLNSPKTLANLNLIPLVSDFDFSQEFEMQDPNVDMDLVVYAKNPQGHECQISPTNKYCAYGQHWKDSKLGEANTEVVRIKDWAVASYKSVVQPAGQYGTTCPEFAGIAARRVLANNGWNWNEVKKYIDLEKIKFFIKRAFKPAGAAPTENLSDAIPIQPPVESPEQAKVEKVLVNKGGKKANLGEKISTYVKSNKPKSDVPIPESIRQAALEEAKQKALEA